MTPDEQRAPPAEGRTPGQLVRLAVIGVAVLVVLTLVVQNQEPVRTRFLTWSVEMPRFLLLAGVYVAGAVTGWIAHWRSRR